jgi:hypothetical protein
MLSIRARLTLFQHLSNFETDDDRCSTRVDGRCGPPSSGGVSAGPGADGVGVASDDGAFDFFLFFDQCVGIDGLLPSSSCREDCIEALSSVRCSYYSRSRWLERSSAVFREYSCVPSPFPPFLLPRTDLIFLQYRRSNIESISFLNFDDALILWLSAAALASIAITAALSSTLRNRSGGFDRKSDSFVRKILGGAYRTGAFTTLLAVIAGAHERDATRTPSETDFSPFPAATALAYQSNDSPLAFVDWAFWRAYLDLSAVPSADRLSLSSSPRLVQPLPLFYPTHPSLLQAPPSLYSLTSSHLRHPSVPLRYVRRRPRRRPRRRQTSKSLPSLSPPQTSTSKLGHLRQDRDVGASGERRRRSTRRTRSTTPFLLVRPQSNEPPTPYWGHSGRGGSTASGWWTAGLECD